MSLLDRQSKAILTNWLCKKTQSAKFELLYKGTWDEFTPSVFHKRCDNKGATVTVAMNSQQYLFGGFTAASWTSTNTHIKDDQAFLFRLKVKHKLQPLQFLIKPTQSQFAIHTNPSWGPTFGGGVDVTIFSNNSVFDGRFIQGGSCNALGNTYPTTGVELCGNDMLLSEIEVYKVAIEDYVILPQPWRLGLAEWTAKVRAELLQEVASYKPFKGLGVSRTRILLLGCVGAGKSSFFNTVQSVFRGHVTVQAASGSSQHSLTSSLRTYTVRSSLGGVPLNFMLCDTMGLEEDQGLNSADVAYILDGHVPNRFQFNPLVRISPDSPGFIKTSKLSSCSHCVVFVLDGSTIDVLSTKMVEKIRAIKEVAVQKAIPVAVIMTKTDKICPLVATDITALFHSGEIERVVMVTADKLGIPPNHVIPVKNYETEVELSVPVDIITLSAMRQVLRFADNYFDEQIDLLEQDLPDDNNKD